MLIFINSSQSIALLQPAVGACEYSSAGLCSGVFQGWGNCLVFQILYLSCLMLYKREIMHCLGLDTGAFLGL